MQMQFCSSASFSAPVPFLEVGLTSHWSDLQDDYDGGDNDKKGDIEDDDDDSKDNQSYIYIFTSSRTEDLKPSVVKVKECHSCTEQLYYIYCNIYVAFFSLQQIN